MSFAAIFLHYMPTVLCINQEYVNLIQNRFKQKLEGEILRMKTKLGKSIVKELVNEFAKKKAGANCAGFMYEVKKPKSI